MADESKDKELDLTNIDSLLQDLEKDLEAAPATPAAAGAEGGGSPPPVSEPSFEIPDLPPPVELDALKPVTVHAPPVAEVAPPAAEPAAPAVEPATPIAELSTPAAVPEEAAAPPAPPTEQGEEDKEESTEELLSPPVRLHERDESDEMEDMFTDEEDEHAKPARAAVADEEEEAEAPVVKEAPKPAPAAPAAAPTPAVSKEDESFLDALELEVEEKPAAPVASLAEDESAAVTPPEVGTPEKFRDALRAKNYSYALQIGQSLRSAEASVPFRINLAGAMYHAGKRKEAEQELASILESNPYHVVARRNLEFVRAGH